MGVFGFGNVGGAVADEGTAGFPTSGLVALYKCDERTGDKLYDATGRLGPIVLNTGIALDCGAAASYLVDATSLHTAINDAALDVIVAWEGVTPALASTGTNHRITSGSSATAFAINTWFSELAYTGGNRFGFHTRMRTNIDAGGVANRDLNLGTTHFPGFAASTAYQIIARFFTVGTSAYVGLSYRAGSSGPWSYIQVVYGTTGASHIMVAAGAAQLFVTSTATEQFAGKCSALMIARAMSVNVAKAIMERPQQTYVAGLLASYDARYWDFRVGTGSTAREWKSTASPTIAGTPTWAVAQAGIAQSCLRQGESYSGPAGVRIGGESGFAAGVGYGASAVEDSPIISSPDGWSVIATLRTGNRIPATDQFLVSVYGPREDGTYSTTPTIQPGVHMVLDDAGLIRGVWKRHNVATASAGTEAGMGASADTPSNGLFATFCISCDSTGIVTMRRMVYGDTSVTTEYTLGAANADNLSNRAIRCAIGNASFGADAIIGFFGIYSRVPTDAEISQCHKMSVARMRGAEITVLAAATAGNGTSRYPYGVMTSAMRVMQPGQIVNVGAGTYKRISNAQPAALFPSSSTNIWIKGAGMTTTIIQADASGVGNHPVELNSGSWRFSDCKFGARDISNAAVTTGTTNTVDSLTFDRCWFHDAKVGTATGTGLVTRAKYVELNDCESSHNGEHGLYLRIASEAEGNHRAVIRGLYCHDNTEDGLKFAADTTSPDMATQVTWSNCIVDGLKVEGGKNQLWLAGIKDSVVTNCLLLNKTHAGLDSGAIYLGYPLGSGTAATEDGCENVSIANVTIYNAAGAGILDARSISTTLRNVICSQGDDDLVRGTDGTAVLTYCAGDADTNKIEAGTGNLIDATISFTNAGAGTFTLASGSDGEGDGVNLTGLSDEAEADFAGTARPAAGAWNMGAY